MTDVQEIGKKLAEAGRLKLRPLRTTRHSSNLSILAAGAPARVHVYRLNLRR
jgi:hypothetical protein